MRTTGKLLEVVIIDRGQNEIQEGWKEEWVESLVVVGCDGRTETKPMDIKAQDITKNRVYGVQ
jgi:hypothetical protein